ncbi:MAG: TadG family pilus assembly protein, partial [Rhodovibrionaceae bacterium]|nr:TadG family pilus assembly protein [Rhodovibrionaceae bacterium]
MRNPGANRLLAFFRTQDGAIAVLSSFLIGLFALVAALVIDMGYGFVSRNQLQVTADASALAGASQLAEDDAAVMAEANAFAELNMPAARYGDVLADSDIEIGHWDNDTRVFTAGGTPRNAVRVTTRRSAAAGNAVNTFFAQIAGIDSLDVNTAAVAVNGADEDRLHCLHAMNPTQAMAFHIHGAADIVAAGCDIQVDSCDPDEAVFGNGAFEIVLSEAGGLSGA